MIDYEDIGWWYWLVIVTLLTVGMTVYPQGYGWAVGMAAVQCLHFAVRERSASAFPVQVRAWYLALLVLAAPQPLRAIIWLPVVGTWIRLVFGYCLLARCVSLLPPNRREPLSWSLLRRTLLSPPVRGNVMQGRAGRSPPA